jgi:hypothetical protein
LIVGLAFASDGLAIAAPSLLAVGAIPPQPMRLAAMRTIATSMNLEFTRSR